MPGADPSRRRLALLLRAVRWFVTAALLLALVLHVWRNSEDYRFVASLDWRFLLPIFLLSLGRLLLEALRYSATAAIIWQPLPLLRAFAYLSVGRLLNKLVPQSGLVYKVRMLQSAEAATPRDVLSVLGTLSWMQWFFSLAIALPAVAISAPQLSVAGVHVPTLLAMLLALTLAASAALAVWAFRHGGDAEAGPGAGPSAQVRWAAALRRLLLIRGRTRLLAVNAMTIGGAVLLAIARVMLALMMLGEPPGVATGAVFVVVNRIATVITITPGNLGVTEFAYGALAGELGLGVAQGITIALVIRFVTFLSLALVGLALTLPGRPGVQRRRRSRTP